MLPAILYDAMPKMWKIWHTGILKNWLTTWYLALDAILWQWSQCYFWNKAQTKFFLWTNKEKQSQKRCCYSWYSKQRHIKHYHLKHDQETNKPVNTKQKHVIHKNAVLDTEKARLDWQGQVPLKTWSRHAVSDRPGMVLKTPSIVQPFLNIDHVFLYW